ncbi:MAG: hypothetical protein SFY96_13105 [Planctomycetota bacterium]|nr:hypothetical protein [Planctomycetota bacterium]
MSPPRERQAAPSHPDEFYVNYLLVPSSLAALLRILVAILLTFIAGLAGVWSESRRNAGGGTWDDAQIQTFSGQIIAIPYAMLLPDAPDARPLLIVEAGKHGGGQRALPLLGKSVSIRGTRLHRDGREMLELDPSPDAITAAPATVSPAATAAPRSLGRIALRGEIVDSKCYLGAMKPGDGKTHKACASLCVRGGIPPMLVSTLPDGTLRFTLLADEHGEPISDQILPLVADPVEVQGDLVSIGGVECLRVRVSDIRRL